MFLFPDGEFPFSVLQDDLYFSQAVLDALPYPVLVKDTEGRYLRCNREFELWTGATRDNVVGRTLFEIAPPEFRDECVKADREVLAEKSTRSFEGKYRAADGSERQILVQKAPLFHQNGTIGIVTTFLDISTLKETEQTLRANGVFWKNILDEMKDAVAIINGRTLHIQGANKAFLSLFGITADSAVGKKCHDVVFPSSGPFRHDGHSMCPLSEAVLTGKPTVMEHTIRTAEGREMWLEVATSPIYDENGSLRHLAHVCRDITARKEAARQIEHLAYFDSLTGLPNRTLFLDRSWQALHLAQREGRSLAVLFLDLDDFKKVNDLLGHAAGDGVLQTVAERLKKSVRQSDTLSRTGGDEFAILLSSAGEMREALAAAGHLQDSLSLPVHIDDREISIGASIGIALFPEDGQTPEELHRTAELAMYEGKKEGGGTCQFYSQEMNRRASERLQMELDLRRALRHDELFLQFQPQVDAASGRVIGGEALVRWRHPALGVVPPGRFIALAEETGLIVPMGEWVLRKACLQARLWQQEGLGALRLGVNISPAQFRRTDIPSMVRKILMETGFNPCNLELELTEGILLQKDEGVRDCLQKLKDMGISIAIDDFGTGYSSLSYLKHFPIDCIKVAQEFIREIPASAEHMEIVKAIVAMARSLNLGIIVEGVETKEQLVLLRDMGIRHIQGFHFARPMDPEDLVPYIREFESANCVVEAPDAAPFLEAAATAQPKETRT